MTARRGAAVAAGAVLLLALLAGCPGPGGDDRPVGPQTSGAAEDVIAKAATDEERRALEEARAEIDAEGRREVAAKDAEIARLRRENEELRRQLK